MVVYKHTPVSVSDKCIIVVDGTSGIGQVIALGFVSEGTDVLATSRRKSAIDKMADAIEELGTSVVREIYDVADPASLEHVRECAVEEFGDVDAVIASQGVISREAVRDVDDDAWDHITDIALGSVHHMTQELAPAVADGGPVINISSLAARPSMANLPAYSVAKDDVGALTRTLAKEPTPEIRVDVIAPGFTTTSQNADTYTEGAEKRKRINERTPLGRVAERGEIIGAAVFLTNDAFSLMTGEVVIVDGGFVNGTF